MKKFSIDIKPIVDEYAEEVQTCGWAIQLNLLLIETANNYLLHFNKQFEKLGITHPAFPILFCLLESGGETTQTALLRKTSVTKQSLGASIKILEEKGLVVRRTLQRDQRKKQVQLTDKGISLVRTMMPIRRNYYFKFMNHLSEDEGKDLTDKLHKVNAFYVKEIKKLNRKKK